MIISKFESINNLTHEYSQSLLDRYNANTDNGFSSNVEEQLEAKNVISAISALSVLVLAFSLVFLLSPWLGR